MYIVFAPSKSGTTSFFKLFTSKNMFPAIQTHDFAYFNVHDKPDGELVRFIRKEIGESSITYVDYFDENIEWNAEFESYLFLLPCGFRSVFLDFIKNAKIVMPWRCPYERSVSAFLHWSQAGQIGNALKIKHASFNDLLICEENQIEFDVMNKMLTYIREHKEKVSLEMMEMIFCEYFKGKLCDEYKRVRFVYDTELQNMNTLRFDLKALPLDEIKDFLGLENIIIPRERDKACVQEYVFADDVNIVCAKLHECAKLIAVSEEDKMFFKSSNEI